MLKYKCTCQQRRTKERGDQKVIKTGPSIKVNEKRDHRKRRHLKSTDTGVHNIYLDSYQRQNSKRVDL